MLFNLHTARLCQLTLVAPLAALCGVLAFASGCDTVLSIEKPKRRAMSPLVSDPDSGVVPGRPGGAPDDAGATMTCSDEMECCPDCAGGAKCGSDGCGGSCGDCDEGEVCTKDRICTCVPDCEGKVCGSDGCGGTCAMCKPGQECSEDGTECTCVPQCEDRECGPDGCGGMCSACEDGLTCNTRMGSCETDCVPSCEGRECGSNGCGEGICPGECATGEACDELTGRCVCKPNCEGLGLVCGADGCGGTCGTCRDPRSCEEGQCVCVPKTECDAGQCGSIEDGCGGTVTCAECRPGQTCHMGACCTPMCGDECGSVSDGCGGTIDCACEPGEMCNSARTCVVRTPPPTCAGATVVFCDELPVLPMGPPTIDGNPDCAAPLREIEPVGWTEGDADIPPGVAARYSAAWTATGLYLYVEVDVGTGTVTPAGPGVPYFCGDSVEIDVVLDGELGDYYRVPGGGQTVVRAPENGVMSHTAEAYAHIHTDDRDYAEPRTWTDPLTIGAYARPGGYTVEALITGAAVGGWEGTLMAGQRVGFDIGINVAAPPETPADQIDGRTQGCPTTGVRLGQFYLQTATRRVSHCGRNGDPWCTPWALCNPELR
jgi:hypothetical protein